jgi:isopentenyl diphosphate isomerase/L-lactate dehydrogenase-like FMN-dependent dehydrogenase
VSETDPTPVRVADYEDLARPLLSEATWAYVEGGAGDELSLQANVDAWQEVTLWPHSLVDVGHVETSTTLLGHRLPHPILIAPTAAHRMYHPEAEAATLVGASAAGALAVMSNLGSTHVAELGSAAGGPWWFQLYVQPDRGFTQDLVQRVAAAGASAVVLTVDTPLLGARDRDRRLGGHTVDGMQPVNLAPVATGPRDGPHGHVYNPHIDPTLTWDTLAWLVDVSPVPVLVKGIVRGDDAGRAVDSGAAGVVVSNHGARNLDTVVATGRALPYVIDAVQGRVPVLVDGGIRRGTDVAKALGLGADAVLIGRPAVWGLTVDGARGVAHVVDLLLAELVMAMALLGAPSIAALTPELFQP